MTTPDDTTAGPTFADFGLDERIQAALDELGFTKPTDIQEAALPALLTGRDVIGRARTGSGKTAAFGIPLLERVKDSSRGVRALVLAPTRELAQQVSAALQSYGGKLGLRGVTIYGGAPYGPQLKALRAGVPIVVGTPGRLLDHLGSGALDLSELEYVVLDEADEMLRMGFVDDVETLMAAMPDTRQVALFSATMPAAIKRIAKKYLKDPVTLQMEDGAPATAHIQQAWTRVPRRFKPDALQRALLGGDRGTTLVFSRTRAGCAEVASHLDGLGLRVEALHGDMNQSARNRTLAKLRAGDVEVVVCTDIAARGIDVDHITQVINLDLPENAEVYVHRIGRTGRAGRAGRALTMVTPAEIRRFGFFQKKLGQQVQEVGLPSDAELAKKGRDRLAIALAEATTDGADAWLEELLEEGEASVEEIAASALSLLASMRGVQLGENASGGDPAWARGRAREPNRHDGPPRRSEPRPPQPQPPRRNDGPPRQEQRRHDGPPQRGGGSPYRTNHDGPPRKGPPSRGFDGPPQRQQGFGGGGGQRSGFGGPPQRQGFGGGQQAGGFAPPQRQGFAGAPRGGGEVVEIFVPLGREAGIRPSDLVGALANEAGIPGNVIGRITIEERKSFVGLPSDVAAHVLKRTPRLEVRGRQVALSRSRGKNAPLPSKFKKPKGGFRR